MAAIVTIDGWCVSSKGLLLRREFRGMCHAPYKRNMPVAAIPKLIKQW